MKTNARLGRVNRMTCVDSHYCTGVAETAYLTATWIQSQRVVPDRAGDNQGYSKPLRPSHLPVLDRHSRAAHCTPSRGRQGPLSCGHGKSKMGGPSSIDETILRALDMLHDAIPYEENVHHLLFVVKASSYKEVRCGGHQSLQRLKQIVMNFVKQRRSRTWSLTSRLPEANHGKSTRQVIAEYPGRRRAPRRPETVT